MSFLSGNLILPATMIALLGFAVPRVLARVFPEGVKPLLLNTFLSTVLLFLISALFFACLYLWQGVPVGEIAATGWAANILFFGRLGLISGMIWAPIMLLSVAGLPRKWVNETW